MFRKLSIFLAVLALGPLACDPPDDGDGDATSAATTDEGTTGETDTGDESSGEAIDPTPIPFQPPLRDCRPTSGNARIRDCDP
jgi:hypothetical protein